jgi:SAM-dependent methyltransferase
MSSQYQDIYPIEKKLQYLDFDWNNKRVIDLGCNVGQLSQYVMNKGARSYLGIEIRKEYYEEAVMRYGNKDPFVFFKKANLFDVWNTTECEVLCAFGLLHHLDDKAVQRLFLHYDFDEFIFECPMDVQPLRNFYIRTFDWYEEILESFEFEVINQFKNPIDYQYNPPRDIYVCRKRK